jgi:hypothetical protein
VNGVPVAWQYDAAMLRTIISTPSLPKTQALVVEAQGTAGAIVALGEAHNAACRAADVQRLLRGSAGAPWYGEPLDADAVLALPEISGKRDAIARVGGPFARFVPFTTVEEASQQLGRVIVGAPADGSSYDVEVRFTLHRGATPRVETVRYMQTTAAKVVDAPFAYDGNMCAQRCEAEVTLTWRGVSWKEYFSGPLLFPTITNWHVIAFPAEEAPEPTAMFAVDGVVSQDLDWHIHQQDVARIPALDEPHSIHFIRDYEKQLWSQQPLVGYIAAKVISSQEREVVLEFRSGGVPTLFCNGIPLEVLPDPAAADTPIWSRPIERTVPFMLREGENTLLIRTTPAPDAPHPHWWFFGARLALPDGSPLTGVDYQ